DPKPKAGFTFLSVRQIESDLHGAARIQSRAEFAGEPCAFKRCWLRQVSVPTYKLLPIACEGALWIGDIKESDSIRKLGIVRISREQRAAFEVHIRLHMEQALVPHVAQDPFAVPRDGQS